MSTKSETCKAIEETESGKCPIPNTHQRYLEAHILWHQVIDNYQDPILFSTYINASIQALRNITFILQSEKKNIPDFDLWYQVCRDNMRNDPIMKWLQQARNIIVKQGDLEKSSLAIVSLKNWLDYPLWEIEAPPFMSTEEMVEFVGQHMGPIPKELGDVVLCVERRWVVSDFPDLELSDILAHGFGVLRKIVMDAHSRCGSNIIVGNMQDSGRPSCMLALASTRSSYYNLVNKNVFNVEFTDKPLEEGLEEVAREKYKLKESLPELFRGKKDIYSLAEASIEMSKIILVKDGFHGGVISILLPDGSIKICECNPPDNESKYVMYREIGDTILKLNAVGIIFITEVWTLPAEDYEGERPSVSPKRKEALQVTIASKDGPVRTYVTPFTRDESGNIIMEDTRVLEKGVSFFLKPILDVWKRGINGT